MAMLGRGVLAIWNGIAPEADEDFVAWHVREHIPERVGVPGFQRGRRYASEDAAPRYFNFYETTAPDVLTSDAYRSRLDSPSEWTRNIVQHFTDTSRTICRVVVTQGAGQGGWIETFRIFGPVDGPALARAAAPLLTAILDNPGIVAAHLLEGEDEASRSGSAEKAMRAHPHEVVAWILLVEAVDRERLDRLEGALDIGARLRSAGAAGPVVRGTYRFQYGLSRDDMAART